MVVLMFCYFPVTGYILPYIIHVHYVGYAVKYCIDTVVVLSVVQ